MKKMTTKAQMQANGGAWTHCHSCGKDFWRPTKKWAIKTAYKHLKSKRHKSWGHGKFEDCPNI